MEHICLVLEPCYPIKDVSPLLEPKSLVLYRMQHLCLDIQDSFRQAMMAIFVSLSIGGVGKKEQMDFPVSGFQFSVV